MHFNLKTIDFAINYKSISKDLSENEQFVEIITVFECINMAFNQTSKIACVM